MKAEEKVQRKRKTVQRYNNNQIAELTKFNIFFERFLWGVRGGFWHVLKLI